jgi:hypothetical protein
MAPTTSHPGMKPSIKGMHKNMTRTTRYMSYTTSYICRNTNTSFTRYTHPAALQVVLSSHRGQRRSFRRQKLLSVRDHKR